MTADELGERLNAWSVWYRCRHQDKSAFTPQIEAVEKAVAGLGDIEKAVIRQVFLRRQTRFAVARGLDIPPGRVSNVTKMALERLEVTVELWDRDLLDRRVHGER